MKKWSWVLLAFVVGCNPSTPTSTSSTSPPSPSTTPGTTSTTPPDSKTKPGDSTSATPATGSPSSQTPPSLTSLPASLKHAAFEYYGLGVEKPIPMVLREAGQPDRKGSVEVKLVEVSGETAKFEQTFTDGLATDLGKSTYSLDKSGVFALDLNGQPFDKPQLELPADVTPGKKWSLEKAVQAGPVTIDKMDNQIVGVEQVTVPRGSYSALKVTAAVSLSQGGAKSTGNMTAWYVKGLGTIKLTMDIREGNKKILRTLLATK